MGLKRFGFVPWMVFFLTALSLISVLLIFSLPQFAKIIGIIITVTLVILMRYWLYQLKKSQRVTRISLNANDRHEINALLPWFSKLKEEEKNQVIHRIGLQMGALTILNPDSVNMDSRPAKSWAVLLSIICLTVFEVKDETPICTVILKNNGDMRVESDTIEVTLEWVHNRINELSENNFAFLKTL